MLAVEELARELLDAARRRRRVRRLLRLIAGAAALWILLFAAGVWFRLSSTLGLPVALAALALIGVALVRLNAADRAAMEEEDWLRRRILALGYQVRVQGRAVLLRSGEPGATWRPVTA